MPNVQLRILPETLRSRDSATFTGSYQTLGSVLSNTSRLLKITNNSDVDVTISWDGTNDHEFVPSGSFVLLDFCSNRAWDAQLVAAAQTQFYIKGSAGTGSVYLSTYYAT
jgi:hypothetical protein